MMKRILIADDEPHMRRFLELSLKKGCFEFLFATNGQEAIDQASQNQPDMIVMDVTMPVMDGLAALSELKRLDETREIPVIMITARGHILTRQEAELSGAALFLTKPFSPTQLLRKVRELLAGQQAAIR